MRQSITWTMALAVLACAVFSRAASGQQGATNGPKKTWQVRYHRDHSNPKSQAIAIRLTITAGGGNNLFGTLTRYTSVGDPDTHNKRYYVAKSVDRDVPLSGRYAANGNLGYQRKRGEFELSGIYFDEAGEKHIIMVKGFHYTGRSKAASDAGPADDILCVRVIDKPWSLLTGRAAPAPGDQPCDEQPPDEDVLTEEDVPPDMAPIDPEYDAEAP